MQLKTQAANEIKALAQAHQDELKKYRKQLVEKELELMEERHGHEDHVKMTEQVINKLNQEMDNLRNINYHLRSDSMRESSSSAAHSKQYIHHHQKTIS